MKTYTIKPHNFQYYLPAKIMVNMYSEDTRKKKKYTEDNISVNAILVACGLYDCCICWFCHSIYSSRSSCRCILWTFVSIPFDRQKAHICVTSGRQHHDHIISSWNIS
jgi:hypothetical protein